MRSDSRSIKSFGDPVMNLLRHARPIKTVLVELIGENKTKIKECEVPDFESIVFIDEGFDPRGMWSDVLAQNSVSLLFYDAYREGRHAGDYQTG